MELSKINQPEGLFNWLRRNFTSPFPLQEIVGDGSFQFSHPKTLFLLIWSPNHGTLMTPTLWHFLPALWRSPPRSGKGEGTTEWHFSICVGMIDGPIRYQRVLSCPDQRRTSCARDIPLSAFTSQFQGQLKENVASFPSGNPQIALVAPCGSCTSWGWRGCHWHKKLTEKQLLNAKTQSLLRTDPFPWNS